MIEPMNMQKFMDLMLAQGADVEEIGDMSLFELHHIEQNDLLPFERPAKKQDDES